MAAIKEKKSKRVDSKLFEGIEKSAAAPVIQKVTPVEEHPAKIEKKESKPTEKLVPVFFKMGKSLKKGIDLYLVQNEIKLSDFFIELAKEKLKV